MQIQLSTRAFRIWKNASFGDLYSIIYALTESAISYTVTDHVEYIDIKTNNCSKEDWYDVLESVFDDLLSDDEEDEE